jgi:hypothetical protein
MRYQRGTARGWDDHHVKRTAVAFDSKCPTMRTTQRKGDLPTARAQVDLRQIHSNSRGFVVKRVPRDAYDWLYILAQKVAST